MAAVAFAAFGQAWARSARFIYGEAIFTGPRSNDGALLTSRRNARLGGPTAAVPSKPGGESIPWAELNGLAANRHAADETPTGECSDHKQSAAKGRAGTVA